MFDRFFLFLPFCILFAACSSPDAVYREHQPPSGTIEGSVPPEVLAGAPVRAVWLLETGDGSDWRGLEENLILMGYDSEDGRGNRILHKGFPNYQKPLLGPDGSFVIFTDWSTHQIYRLDWGAEEPVLLGPGYALDVWRDPAGRDWVWVGNGTFDDRGNLDSLSRFPLDDPSAVELVADRKVQGSNFQPEFSGKVAGGMFPAPEQGGVIHLETLEVSPFGRGCWSSFSPGYRRLLSILDGRHRNIMVYDTITLERWQVNLSSAPGVDGDKIYYPRWTNHSRFITIAGPIHGDDPMRSEVYLGRFSEDFGRIEAWSRLTDDGRPDIFPDFWIGTPAEGAVYGGATPATGRGAAGAAAEFPVVEIEGVLREVTPTPTLAEIEPYRQALAVYRYEVEDRPGNGGPGSVYVAHWVIREGKPLRDLDRSVGETYPLRLVRYDGNPDYEGERVVSALGEGGEVIYVHREP